MQKKDPSGAVRAVLYSHFKGNAATEFGHTMESVLEEQFIKDHPDIEIIHCGVRSHKQFKYIAGSPDGIGVNRVTDERFLIEYKAPYGLHTSKTSIFDAPRLIPGFCLIEKDGQITVRRRHNYYYQIQGLLEVLDLPYCMLVVGGFESMCTVRVEREHEFFLSVMLPKLREFYFGAILPERAYPMKRRGGLRTELVPVEIMTFAA